MEDWELLWEINVCFVIIVMNVRVIMTDILLPQLGDKSSSSILMLWLKKDGQDVKKGDCICEVEYDKAVVEIQSPANGKLKIISKIGDELDTNHLLGKIC